MTGLLEEELVTWQGVANLLKWLLVEVLDDRVVSCLPFEVGLELGLLRWI